MENEHSIEKMIRPEVPLAMHTWLQIGGPAEYFAEPHSEEELLGLLQFCREKQISVRTLGMGANVLVSEKGVPGMVIRLTDPVFCKIENHDQLVCAGGGAKLGRVITSAVYAGLAGIESFIGIPGTVGGAIHANVLTSDGDLGQWVESLRVITYAGEVLELTKEQIVFGYRNCSIENAIVVSACFRLEREASDILAKRLQKQWILRKRTEPLGSQNTGRLFRNPRGQSAAELIEAVGLRGTKIGGASICDRDANFVVIQPDCTGDDVKRLIQLIQSQVLDRMEVHLELDLEIW